MPLLAALLGFTLQTAPYSDVFEVRDPLRLPLTPRMDGKMDPEEWDGLSSSGGLETAMQWEPGILYAAGRAPIGKDIVWSFDLRGDGWLVGRDNLEIRVSMTDQGPVATSRLVDATDRDGPVWKRDPLLDGMLSVVSATDTDGWVAEIKLLGLYLPPIGDGSQIGVRANAIPAGEASPDAFVPRNTTVTTLRWDRNRNLPIGVEWQSEYKARSVAPGNSFKVRFNFINQTKTARFDKIEMRCQGFLKTFTTESTKPFPNWGRKGRNYVDYQTDVSSEATTGYRLVQGRLTEPKGTESMVLSGFLVAPTVLFDVNLPQDTLQKAESQIVRGSVWVRSQIYRRIDGLFTLDAPSDFTISRGGSKKVIIYQNRGAMRVPLEIIIPQNASGAIPLTFKIRIGDQIIQQTGLLAVRPSTIPLP